jgi:hypothetical protein
MGELDLLTAGEGTRLLAELAELGEISPADQLRLTGSLRARYPAAVVAAALGQHELRRRARTKFSRAEAMWFTRDGLEQASAEPVAEHRARRYAQLERVIDLCCGIGGDLITLAAGRSRPPLAVDRDPLHLRMAALNVAVYGGQVETELADVREVSLAGADGVFVDPARRGGGRRLRTGDSEPPLDWCVRIADRVPAVGVKAAPGIDRDLVPPGWEVEFVADGRDLKEAVLWSPALAGAATRATVLPAGDQLVPELGAPVPIRAPGGYLLDPNPAVTRAGLVAELARSLGAWQFDPMIAFLSSNQPMVTPFGRSLRVLEDGPWREKELPARLRAHDIGVVDIRRRGLAGDVSALHRKLKLSGSRRAVLIMTRHNDRPWALICTEPGPPPDQPGGSGGKGETAG